MDDVPTEDELAEVIYSAVPMKTASGGRLLSWLEIQTLTGYPYPEIVAGHRKEAGAVREYLAALTARLRPRNADRDGRELRRRRWTTKFVNC